MRLYLQNKTKLIIGFGNVELQWVECLLGMHEAPGSILDTKIPTANQGSWKEDPIHSLEEHPITKHSCWAVTQNGDLTNHSCCGIAQSCPLTLSSQNQMENLETVISSAPKATGLPALNSEYG